LKRQNITLDKNRNWAHNFFTCVWSRVILGSMFASFFYYKRPRMNHRQLSTRSILVIVVVVIVLLAMRLASPVRADDPSDGRINLLPWVNSHGAVAVYCSNGGFVVLNGKGKQMLAGSEASVRSAQDVASQTDKAALIVAGSIYRLWALPNGFFMLTSTPDNEGKTFLGKWEGCIPVGGGGAPAPVQTQQAK
jgi:hypothetical protein